MCKNQTDLKFSEAIFILTNINGDHTRNMLANFNHHHSDSLTLNTHQTVDSIVPIFNTDHNYFTPAFILPADNVFYRSNLAYQKLKFNEKMLNAAPKPCPSTQQLTLVAPRSTYCQVCKLHHLDYFKHIHSSEHTRKLKAAKANCYIHELCRTFKKSTKVDKTLKPRKGKARKISKPLETKDGYNLRARVRQQGKKVQSEEMGKSISCSTKVELQL